MWSKYPEIGNELRLVEEKIRSSVKSRNKLVSDIVSDVIMAGGKRLRPAFVVVCAKFGEFHRKKVLAMAGAIEILHTATLIHDDIIDCSKLRRGKVTVSEKYSTDMAVYTGDFLFTKSILMLSEDIKADKLDKVARAIKIICEGEVDQYQDKYKTEISITAYLKRIHRKTAILFGAAAGLGAYIAECPDKIVEKLTKFGICYGMAFQIRDDMNDFLESENISGKPVEKDLTEGIITLPIIYAIKRNKDIQKYIDRLFKERETITASDVTKICGLVRDNRGIEESGKLQKKYIDKGIKILESLPDNEYKVILSQLIKDLII